MYGKIMDKKKKGMSDMEKDARMEVVKGLRKMAEEAMAENGLKKVTVASDSAEGLEKGLEMAKEKVEGMEEEIPEAEMEDSEEESEDMMEEESPEMSEEDLDAKLAELMKMKEALKARKM